MVWLSGKDPKAARPRFLASAAASRVAALSLPLPKIADLGRRLGRRLLPGAMLCRQDLQFAGDLLEQPIPVTMRGLSQQPE